MWAAPASTITVTGTSHKFTSLTSGAAYTFNVLARNPQGPSTATAESTPVTSRKAPGKPTSAAGQPGDSQIVARWMTPANDNGAPVTNYTATATPAAGTPRSCTSAGPEASCTIMGLTNGTQYRVTVTAANSAGTSAASDPSAWITAGYTAGATPATAPTNVSATGANGSAIVTWTPPAQDGGMPITQYTVVATQDPTRLCVTNAVPGTPVTNPANSCVVPGLTNGVAYTFTVTATAPPGGPASAPSNSVTPTVDTRAHTAVGSPGPDTGVWNPRETIQIANGSNAQIDLTGYALWDKDPRNCTDTPDYVFPRGTTIPANATLKVRSGAPTTVEPGSATLHYTGRGPKFNVVPNADLIELSNLNKALVDCAAWGGASCRGQQQVTTPTQPVGITARTTTDIRHGAVGSADLARRDGNHRLHGHSLRCTHGGNILGQCSYRRRGRLLHHPGRNRRAQVLHRGCRAVTW